MPHKILLPQLGISEESAVLTVWLVKQGDAVKRGQKLFSLETGKSTFDVESEAEGTVLALLVSEGDEVPVKTPVCIVGEITDNNEQRTMNNEQITDNSEQTAEDRALIPEKEPPLQIVNCSLSTVNCPPPPPSPRAKKLAEKNDTDPSLAVPTGPHGRIIERDVRQLIENSEPLTANTPAPPVIEKAAAPPTAAYQDNVLPTIRKTIAKTMTASLRSAAQLTHTASFDAANILEYRKLLKNTPGYAGVTLTDMILYAVTRTLPAFPALNAWLTEGDVLRTFNDVSL
ncbi:MAG: 2-oxo acid dehydrogenase subunit E2, partial [Oscillospiraceae bacterium]|nr:2-oxo acid dehydrogenase subunit E2 [Oscillospiraceae bacterium]